MWQRIRLGFEKKDRIRVGALVWKRWPGRSSWQLSHDVQMRRTWWWQARREGYSICNGIKTNMGEAESKADGIRCENQAGAGTYRALIRSLDFICVPSGSFKQISCKDITQTYLHFKKFLLHCGEWLQGEQEWKLSARLGGWTSVQERSVPKGPIVVRSSSLPPRSSSSFSVGLEGGIGCMFYRTCFYL